MEILKPNPKTKDWKVVRLLQNNDAKVHEFYSVKMNEPLPSWILPSWHVQDFSCNPIFRATFTVPKEKWRWGLTEDIPDSKMQNYYRLAPSASNDFLNAILSHKLQVIQDHVISGVFTFTQKSGTLTIIPYLDKI